MCSAASKSWPARRVEFCGGVLGFKQLSTLNVGNGGGVARFQAGCAGAEARRAASPTACYLPAACASATGLRLLTFYFADEAALTADASVQHGLPAPGVQGSGARERRRTALVHRSRRPAGRARERSPARAEQLGAHRGRHGRGARAQPSVLSQLRGSRGAAARGRRALRHAQVLVPSWSDDHQPARFRQGPARRQRQRRHSVRRRPDVASVDALAKERNVVIAQPLSRCAASICGPFGSTIPDGVTNYFAETGAEPRGAAPAAQ